MTLFRKSPTLEERAVIALETIAAALDPKPLDVQRLPGHCPHCGAPEEKQANAGTLNDPHRKRCLNCQTEYHG